MPDASNTLFHNSFIDLDDEVLSNKIIQKYEKEVRESILDDNSSNQNEIEYLKVLRKKETAYTESELQFLYNIHGQAEYKYENLQNPESLEELKET